MPAYPRQLKDGTKWRYKGYHRGDYYTSPAKYDSKADALRAERVFLGSRTRDTLEYCIQERMNHLRINATSPKHWRQNELDFDIARNHWGADTPIASITRAMAQELVNGEALRRLKEGRSNHSVNKTIRSLRSLFNYCITVKGIAMANPFSGVKLLPVGDKDKYIPTDWEVFLVRESLSVDQKRLFDFVAETGCRISEALRLKVKNVYPDRVMLFTRKSKNSNLTPRVIPRPKCLLDEDVSSDPDQRIFSGWIVGEPKFLERHIKGLIKDQEEKREKGIDLDGPSYQRWNWHNLRHRAASLWAKAGMPMIEISARLGHGNLKTTQNYLQVLGYSSIPFTQYGSLSEDQFRYDYHPDQFEESEG